MSRPLGFRPRTSGRRYISRSPNYSSSRRSSSDSFLGELLCYGICCLIDMWQQDQYERQYYNDYSRDY